MKDHLLPEAPFPYLGDLYNALTQMGFRQMHGIAASRSEYDIPYDTWVNGLVVSEGRAGESTLCRGDWVALIVEHFQRLRNAGNNLIVWRKGPVARLHSGDNSIRRVTFRYHAVKSTPAVQNAAMVRRQDWLKRAVTEAEDAPIPTEAEYVAPPAAPAFPVVAVVDEIERLSRRLCVCDGNTPDHLVTTSKIRTVPTPRGTAFVIPSTDVHPCWQMYRTVATLALETARAQIATPVAVRPAPTEWR